jgi:transcriptional regulator with XRE-family HTH domain
MATRTTLYQIPRLAEIRRAQFLTQGKLADKAKVSRASISAIESGKSATPETVQALATALGISREELVK